MDLLRGQLWGPLSVVGLLPVSWLVHRVDYGWEHRAEGCVHRIGDHGVLVELVELVELVAGGAPVDGMLAEVVVILVIEWIEGYRDCEREVFCFVLLVP